MATVYAEIGKTEYSGKYVTEITTTWHRCDDCMETD